MEGYKLIPEIATADVAFEAESKKLGRLFEICAEAMFDIMIERKNVKNKVKKIIKIEEENNEKLLYSFLEELIFLKDSESLVFGKFEVEINENKLKATCYGEEVDPERHLIKVDVKAVTFHMFYLRQEKGIWKARIVLDI